MQEGGRNISFFHRIVSNRKANNFIKGIYNSNGLWMNTPDSIGMVLLNHFCSLFSTDNSSSFPSPNLPFNILNEVQISQLQRPLDNVEINLVFKFVSLWKALGPYGFHLRFIKLIGILLERICTFSFMVYSVIELPCICIIEPR